MNKICLKRYIVFILVFCLTIGSVFSISNATDLLMNEFNTIESMDDTTDASTKVQSVMATILVTVQVIAVAVAFVILLVLAMKYMTAAPGEKAEIKKSLFVYFIGAVVVFGAVGIIRVIEMLSHALK